MSLRGGGIRTGYAGLQGSDGRDIDDGAASGVLCEELIDGQLAKEEGCSQVDGKDAIPQRAVDVTNWVESMLWSAIFDDFGSKAGDELICHACVVDHDVEAAELFYRLGENLVDGSFIGDIGDGSKKFVVAMRPFKLACRYFQALLINVANRHFRSGIQVCLCNGLS